jgi:multidrug efflux system outer membrane protein
MLPRSTPLALACGALAALLCGCAAVGPDYRGAPPVATDAIAAPRFARDTGAPAPEAPVAAEWWRVLDDATLDALVDQALRASPTLHAAEARLRAARAALGQQQAKGRPSGSASALGVGLWQAPGTDESTTTRLYSLGFDATWELDLFGGTRRAVESTSAEAQAVRADLADAQVSLTAEVAQAYVALRSQQRHLALLRDTGVLDAQSLALMQQRFDRGVSTADELERRRSQGDATQASVAEVLGQVSTSLDRLALLTGQAPGALDVQLASTSASLPSLPQALRVGDPSQLLQRRPDIRAAERRLASSNAQIGQQVANYFPKITLLGDIGFAGTHLGKLLSGDALALVAVPYLSWNVLDFGRTAAAVRQAEAGRDEAAANYESVVLRALQDANTSLAQYGQQRQVLQRSMARQASTARTLGLETQRRLAGVAGELDLLDARRDDIDAQWRSLDAEATLLKDFMSLQKSLGLGWRVEA